MTTPLEETIKRELKVGSKHYVVALSPERLKITLKGRRNGIGQSKALKQRNNRDHRECELRETKRSFFADSWENPYSLSRSGANCTRDTNKIKRLSLALAGTHLGTAKAPQAERHAYYDIMLTIRLRRLSYRPMRT
jgi:hypothetical protein